MAVEDIFLDQNHVLHSHIVSRMLPWPQLHLDDGDILLGSVYLSAKISFFEVYLASW